MCSMFWTTETGDPVQGVGQQMSALNVFNANMMKFTQNQVVSQNTGGSSIGDPGAGSSTNSMVTYPL
jgi:hypothetical protein